MSREGTETTTTDDIGVVADQSDSEDEMLVTEYVTIIGVPHINHACNAKSRRPLN